LDLQKFSDANIEAILENSRSREGARDAKMKQEHKTELKDEPGSETLLKNAEEEERALLSGIAQVRCRLFEGKMIPRVQGNKAIGKPALSCDLGITIDAASCFIAQEWQELQKRARVDRTVMVDGIQVIAAHLGPEVVCWILALGIYLAHGWSRVRPQSKRRRRGCKPSSTAKTGANTAATEAKYVPFLRHWCDCAAYRYHRSSCAIAVPEVSAHHWPCRHLLTRRCSLSRRVPWRVEEGAHGVLRAALVRCL
jgi:hypothetical protein